MNKKTEHGRLIGKTDDEVKKAALKLVVIVIIYPLHTESVHSAKVRVRIYQEAWKMIKSSQNAHEMNKCRLIIISGPFFVGLSKMQM